MKHILIIEDDEYIGNLLEETLVRNNYRITRAYSGTEAMYVLHQSKPDLILLDLMLPGLNGEDILKQITNIPIIIVSAKSAVDDKVELLLNGAVDYITKPFHMKELLARIVVQRRDFKLKQDAPILSFDELTLNIDTRVVRVDDTIIRLTRTEYAILKLLMQHPSQVLTKSFLLEHISSDTPDCTDNSLKIHISNLRKKLRVVHQKDYIEAIWGIGFKLKQK